MKGTLLDVDKYEYIYALSEIIECCFVLTGLLSRKSATFCLMEIKFCTCETVVDCAVNFSRFLNESVHDNKINK